MSYDFDDRPDLRWKWLARVRSAALPVILALGMAIVPAYAQYSPPAPPPPPTADQTAPTQAPQGPPQGAEQAPPPPQSPQQLDQVVRPRSVAGADSDRIDIFL
jgi:hypothetical protein